MSGFALRAMAMTLLLVTSAWSQSQPQDDTASANDTQVQPGPKPAFTYPDTTPSLDFLSQAVENSSLTLGLAGGIGYFSNLNRSSGNGSSSRVLFQIRPSIKIQTYSPKLAWSLGYSGGLQSYTQPSSLNGTNGNNNIFSQNATADILWQLAAHWQLHVNDSFVYSANPFDSYLTSPASPSLNNPAPNTYVPLSRYMNNTGLLELTDRLTAHDTLDFSGTSYIRRTSNSNLVTVPFYNLVSYAGRASYNHQFSPQLTLGVGYNYNSLDFGHGVQRTGAQTLLLSAQYTIRPHMVVSVWVGPEYSSTKNVVGIPVFGFVFYQTTHSSLWSPAGGATFGWQGLRNSFRADFSRQVSDGGGFLPTTLMYRISGTYRRRLARRWDGQLGVTYWNNKSITISNRRFSYTMVDAGVSYEVTRSVLALMEYSYASETQQNITLGAPSYNDNRVQFTVQYAWHHPLGR